MISRCKFLRSTPLFTFYSKIKVTFKDIGGILRSRRPFYFRGVLCINHTFAFSRAFFIFALFKINLSHFLLNQDQYHDLTHPFLLFSDHSLSKSFKLTSPLLYQNQPQPHPHSPLTLYNNLYNLINKYILKRLQSLYRSGVLVF